MTLTPKQIEDALTPEELMLYKNVNRTVDVSDPDWANISNRRSLVRRSLESLAECRIENKGLIGVVLGLKKNLGEYDELCIENPERMGWTREGDELNDELSEDEIRQMVIEEYCADCKGSSRGCESYDICDGFKDAVKAIKEEIKQ